MPESNPKNNLENNMYVQGIRFRMENGKSLEEAIGGTEEEIENSKEYDTTYPQQKALLQEAINYLRSLEKK